MKKIVLLLLMFPVLAQAREIQLSLNAGLAVNTLPLNSSAIPRDETWATAKPGLALSAGALTDLGHWQLGASIELYNAKVAARRDWGWLEYTAKYYTFKFSSPSIPLLLQANRKITLPHSALYFGLSAGAGFHFNGSYSGGMRLHTIGPAAGAQAGCSHDISKHTAIKLDIAARYLWVDQWRTRYHLLVFPITAGLQFRI